MSKLGSIRRSADSTMEKLLIDNEDDTVQEAADTAPAEPEIQPESNASGLLNEAETAFLRALLCGGDWKAAAREHGTLPSLLADSVNDKLFDSFGDTVIDCSADVPELIEDYSDELKTIIG